MSSGMSRLLHTGVRREEFTRREFARRAVNERIANVARLPSARFSCPARESFPCKPDTEGPQPDTQGWLCAYS
jgi:hypothetical protein